MLDALHRDEVKAKVAQHARDLGIDASAGKKRCLTTPTHRRMLMTKRLGRVRQIAVHGGPSQLFFNASLLPKAIFGAAVFGIPPSGINKLRTAASEATGRKRAGYCCTTALALLNSSPNSFMKSVDPAVTVRLAHVKEWLVFWRNADLRTKLAVTGWWLECKRRLQIAGPNCKWKFVKGPVAAIVVMLGDIGWVPERPAQWIDETGVIWVHDEGGVDTKPLLTAIARAALKMAWQRAADHFHGGGLEEGASTEQLARTIRQLQTRAPNKAAVLRAVAEDAVWDAERSEEAGYFTDELCPLCGHTRAGIKHRVWQCPGLDGEDKAISATASLVSEALNADSSEDAFWL